MEQETKEIKVSYTKAVVSGDLVEIIQYEKEPPQHTNVNRPHKCSRYSVYECKPCIRKRLSLAREKDNGNYRRAARHIQRAKNNFRRMVRASLTLGKPYLCTLTMVSTESIDTAYTAFSKFTANLRLTYGRGVAWVAVPEFQQRGAVHFHALIWGIPHEDYIRERYTRDLQALWQRGWLDICTTDGSPKLASYLAKYLSKEMHDGRLGSKKSYTASRNALRSVLYNSRARSTVYASFEDFQGVTLEQVISKATARLDEVEVDVQYNTRWLGRCRYRKIVVKNI